MYHRVFIDADKKIYKEYLQDLMGMNSSDEVVPTKQPLLQDGAIILVDNTLWKGLVLQHEEDLKDLAPQAHLYGNADRMESLAEVMHMFNKWVAEHPKLDSVVLPLRDGLTVIRYKA